MLVRPGTCTKCHATFQLPSEFSAPFVRCRICKGAVQVAEPIEVEPPPAPVATAPEAASGSGETEAQESEEHGHDVSVEQAVSRTLYEAADRAHDAAEALEDAGDELVDAGAHASPEAFGMDSGHDHSALAAHVADAERHVDELEARIHADDVELDEMELELEALELDDDDAGDDDAGDDDADGEAATTAAEQVSTGHDRRDSSADAASEAFGMDGAHDHSHDALERDLEQAEHDVDDLDERLHGDSGPSGTKPSPMPARSAAAWSPAAMERADDATSTAAERETKAGGTLARLKAERAAAAAAASAAPSMLEQLKARRAAEAAAASPANEKPMSTLERLKAERAAEAARTHRPDSVEAKPVSTLERLKAERAAAATAPAAASSSDEASARSGSRRSKGRGASSRRGTRGDQEAERSGAPRHFRSREEQKKRQMVMGLSGLGALVVGVAVSAYGLQAGWFDAPEAEATPEVTEQESAGANTREVEFIDIFAGTNTSGAAAGAAADGLETEAAEGGAPDTATPDGPLSDIEQESADTGKSLEQIQREKREQESGGQ
ncbi:hypothetical protein Pla163_22890 [Planctomycetes bacterium Pla163]|uniref:Uncharacterized protein n=1 Tax=Rohdeia mirabilis TaxID=2528008 RepID=A0A518D0Z6_9BACT|nr:hypothetical protein Pla163_22890 [Planctomycetes bacterium Pla163]